MKLLTITINKSYPRGLMKTRYVQWIIWGQSRSQLSNHQSSHRVYIVTHQTTCTAPSEDLGGTSEELQTEQEEIEEEESSTHADEDDSPSMSVVDAACGGDFRPGCITDILGTFCEYEEECQCFRRRRSCIDKSTQNATSPSSKWRRRSGWIQ